MTRQEVFRLQRNDPQFAQSYEDAMDEAADRIEAEVWRRALDGIAEPLVKAGQIVRDTDTGEPIMTRRYSDPLLVLLLKGSKPEKYSDRRRKQSATTATDILQDISKDCDPPYRRD